MKKGHHLRGTSYFIINYFFHLFYIHITASPPSFPPAPSLPNSLPFILLHSFLFCLHSKRGRLPVGRLPIGRPPMGMAHEVKARSSSSPCIKTFSNMHSCTTCTNVHHVTFLACNQCFKCTIDNWYLWNVLWKLQPLNPNAEQFSHLRCLQFLGEHHHTLGLHN